MSGSRRAVPGPARPPRRQRGAERRAVRARRGSSAQHLEFDLPSAAQRAVNRLVEHIALIAEDLGEREHVRLGRRVNLAERGDELSADASAHVLRELVRLILTPLQPPLQAVAGGLRAGIREQRPYEDAVTGAHAEQRAAARRGREPVQDRLDLIGRGVARRDVAAVGEHELGGRVVALGPRPRLEIAGVRNGRMTDLEWHSEPGAERPAMMLVAVGGRSQPIVDVKRADRARAGDPHGEVEEAGRVPSAGQQDEHASPLRDQTRFANPALDRRCVGHRL